MLFTIFRYSKLAKEFIKKYYLKKICVIFFISTLSKNQADLFECSSKKIKKFF
ncbi:hypothetical protein ACINWC136_3059 [Acinetobacter pittii]|nr:hypothetical protein ACINWC136_3059 [Acinetobacter pittii]